MALTGMTVSDSHSERKRLVRAFGYLAGAHPEPFRETGAYLCVKENEEGSIPLEFGWYHESLRPIAAGLFLRTDSDHN